jgi:hypothetical protein
MSLPIVITTSNASGGAVNSNPVALDYWISPFNVALSVVVTGTVNYTVQYTFVPIPMDGTAFSPTWSNHPTLTSQTTTMDANIAYPVTAVRIVQNSGSGSCTFTVIQAAIGGY